MNVKDLMCKPVPFLSDKFHFVNSGTGQNRKMAENLQIHDKLFGFSYNVNVKDRMHESEPFLSDNFHFNYCTLKMANIAIIERMTLMIIHKVACCLAFYFSHFIF
jgi:hypothetical protein